MRRFDKLKNIQEANMLAEQRYLLSKGLYLSESVLNEGILNEDRMSMAEFLGEVTDDPNVLLKMFSKYQPNDTWFMTVGYANNLDVNVRVPNERLPELENIARKLNNPAFSEMINSEEWKTAKEKGGKFTNPFAGRTVNKVKIPSKIYTTKSFTIQWNNMRVKADKDAQVKKVYDKYGLEWTEGGKVATDDRRGLGWDDIPGTPFQQHQNTGTKRLAIYYKKDGVKNSKTKYYLNYGGDIAELTKDEVNFIFSLSPRPESKMSSRLLAIANQEAAQEIHRIENLYKFKTLNLDKITYIRCSMNVDGVNKKFSYVNKNVAPEGLNPGEFAQFIDPT